MIINAWMLKKRDNCKSYSMIYDYVLIILLLIKYLLFALPLSMYIKCFVILHCNYWGNKKKIKSEQYLIGINDP